MSRLDEELERIIIDVRDISQKEIDDSDKESIKQIKQVFIDDGWRNTNEYGIRIVTKEQLMNEINQPVITGQEWYDRFDDELELWFKEKSNYGFLKENIKEVAKRATGLK